MEDINLNLFSFYAAFNLCSLFLFLHFEVRGSGKRSAKQRREIDNAFYGEKFDFLVIIHG